MIKTLVAAEQSERDKLRIPRSVQQSIPVKRIYSNGIWQVGRKHSRSWKLTDVNYIAASDETRRSIYTAYCATLNSLPTDATAKITIVNHRLNPAEFERRILLPYKAYVSHVLRYYPLGRSFMADGNPAIVAVAKTQIGNRGGLKYCEWYGYPYRVEWCAIFVSWCADQCGYIDAGVIPKFAYCPEGANWFMANGQWQDRYYEPLPGDIIFFDWEHDGVCDHVGIVESCEDGFVYIINGNDGDACTETRYYAGSNAIYGYGSYR